MKVSRARGVRKESRTQESEGEGHGKGGNEERFNDKEREGNNTEFCFPMIFAFL